MTAVSQPVRSSKKISIASEIQSRLVILNSILLCLAVIGLAYYIAGVNGVASSQYHVSMLRDQVAQLTSAQSSLSAEKSVTEDPTAAAAFAQAQHMVEAKDIVYVFENNNVALQK